MQNKRISLQPGPTVNSVYIGSTCTRVFAFTRYCLPSKLYCVSQSSCYASPHLQPILLEYSCTTIAQHTPPHRPLLCMPYTIQYWWWQYRVKANTCASIPFTYNHVSHPSPGRSRDRNADQSNIASAGADSQLCLHRIYVDVRLRRVSIRRRCHAGARPGSKDGSRRDTNPNSAHQRVSAAITLYDSLCGTALACIYMRMYVCMHVCMYAGMYVYQYRYR